MNKRRYEKPAMLVEEFVATQSVAANCGSYIDMDPITISSKTIPQHICDHPNCGHIIDEKRFANLVTKYDLANNDGFKDGAITLFNANECELIYENFDDVADLGKELTGSGSWNSAEHKMYINNIKIPS